MSKKSRFRGCFEKLYGTRAQTLLKSASQHLHHINWSVAGKLYLKMSLLLTCQILGLFINPLATNEMYPVCNRENLRILSQIQLSEKENNFSQIFPAFFKSMLNFEDFEKKITVTAFVFSKLRTLKR